ncbi:MAG: SDR family oxidoreductase [Pirellulales bacterium]|nr:SDR family oxidoreductase [Pirellulales bacterium]
MELLGRIAVVTGSSSGIGRAVALELARAGADVLIHARESWEAAEETARSVAALGRQATVVLADLARHGDQDALVEAAYQWRGEVDAWVNNAGADVLTGDGAGWGFEQKLEAVWQVDVTATMRLTRAIGERMKTRGHGAIINIGWDQATQGMAGDSGELFAASKGAIMAFSKSAALSLAPQVRVNCVAPGWVKTAWGEQASEAWQKRAVRESQLGRWGSPEDVARAARFLASPESSFLTGQVINVNGGFRPR